MRTVLVWLSSFIGDLLIPRRVTPVVPPPPVEPRMVVRATLYRGLMAEVISGPDSTFVDKATFAIAPLAVDAAAAWGAAQGAEHFAARGRRPRPDAIDVEGRVVRDD